MVEVLDENGDTVPPRLVRVLSEWQGDETDAWMHLSDQHHGRPCALEPNRLHCAVSGVSLAVSDRSDLADVFQTLSPDAQTAALVYSGDCFDCVTRPEQCAPVGDGRRFSTLSQAKSPRRKAESLTLPLPGTERIRHQTECS